MPSDFDPAQRRDIVVPMVINVVTRGVEGKESDSLIIGQMPMLASVKDMIPATAFTHKVFK